VLDLTQVAFCDSIGLNSLLDLRYQAEQEDTVMFLACVPAILRRFLELTGTDQILRIYGTVPDAQAILDTPYLSSSKRPAAPAPFGWPESAVPHGGAACGPWSSSLRRYGVGAHARSPHGHGDDPARGRVPEGETRVLAPAAAGYRRPRAAVTPPLSQPPGAWPLSGAVWLSFVHRARHT
jgi:hypothetical protein